MVSCEHLWKAGACPRACGGYVSRGAPWSSTGSVVPSHVPGFSSQGKQGMGKEEIFAHRSHPDVGSEPSWDEWNCFQFWYGLRVKLTTKENFLNAKNVSGKINCVVVLMSSSFQLFFSKKLSGGLCLLDILSGDFIVSFKLFWFTG